MKLNLLSSFCASLSELIHKQNTEYDECGFIQTRFKKHVQKWHDISFDFFYGCLVGIAIVYIVYKIHCIRNKREPQIKKNGNDCNKPKVTHV